MKKHDFKPTLNLLWVLIEIAAVVRAGIATWHVAYYVTNDLFYTIFTVAVIEGVFISSLFLIGHEVVAPIAALGALAFSGVMNYLELLVLDGSLTADDKVILRAVIAFAPIVILGLAFLRRLHWQEIEEDIEGFVDKARARVVKPEEIHRPARQITGESSKPSMNGAEETKTPQSPK